MDGTDGYHERLNATQPTLPFSDLMSILFVLIFHKGPSQLLRVDPVVD